MGGGLKRAFAAARATWCRPKTNKPAASGLYRIVKRTGGYEPQMSFTAGMVKGIFWFPLNSEGYWLEPDAFSHGEVTRHVVMSKEDAERALLRARAIEGNHIILA